jgi:hypothetical protein
VYTMTCPEAAYVQSCSGDPLVCTATCSAPEWAVMPGLLPPLSVDDALLIGSAILAAWGLGVAGRMLRRYVSKR